jgi:hypothetical protein
VSGGGDDGAGMRASRIIPDDVIEAIVRDQPVDSSFAPLVAFARQVRALGDAPVPRPSSELAALLEGRAQPDLGSVDDVGTLGEASSGGRSERNRRMPGIRTLAGVTSKVASLGLVAKIGLGTSLAAAGVASAGTAGVLPASANHAVRDAIEVVSPVEFSEPGDSEAPDRFGERVSSDATGESDGEKGVDGREIADDAPGADHRPDPAVADEAPGQSGETGLTQANETPAAPHAPDKPPNTTPPQGGPADPGSDNPGQPNAPGSVASTVPDPGPTAQSPRSATT